MKGKIEQLLNAPGRRFLFDREKDQLTIEENGRKIKLSLPSIIARYEEEGEEAIRKICYYVVEGFKAESAAVELTRSSKRILPIVRAASFPLASKTGQKFISKEHTAETRIYYAYDLGASYRLLTEEMAAQAKLDLAELDHLAQQNLLVKENPFKVDRVAGNDFYFVRTNDGYDASRILNRPFLDSLAKEFQGETVVAVPHQDVLVVADIRNDTGYDILAHMNLQFFAEGLVPITSLPFVYQHGKLEPIFILAKNQPKE
ncbi:DUF1444 domain-containing protein [Listeria costaricensis]|uniref:DUF1444 domain-containing protein n=1 Tax=Listeria costaricensis TaxID=2026604 RepID=UPI000C08150C|nr:DUF1444 domain-containing protein [Listeria costaricensis]